MSNYHIRSINSDKVIIGDHNTQVNMHDELTTLDAEIERYASLLPDVAAAHRALDALRVECAARPVDANRVTKAAGELTAATATAPALRAEIAQLVSRVAHPGTERRQ